MQSFKKCGYKGSLKKKIIVAIYTILITGLILLVGKTYAKYSQEDEVQFINARVRWPKANEIIYTTTTNKSVTNVEQALNDLYERLGE